MTTNHKYPEEKKSDYIKAITSKKYPKQFKDEKPFLPYRDLYVDGQNDKIQKL